MSSFAGHHLVIHEDYAIVSGHHNVIHGKGCIVSGHNHDVRGEACNVSGHHNRVWGQNSVVSGHHNSVTGRGCTVSGRFNNVTGRDCIVNGPENTILVNLNQVEHVPPSPPPPPRPKRHRVAANPRQVLCEAMDEASVTETDIDALACTVCLTNQRNVLLAPCRHANICSDCVRKMAVDTTIPFRCPTCRKDIKDGSLVYL